MLSRINSTKINGQWIRTVETPKLTMRQIRSNDLLRAVSLFKDKKVMEKIGDGKPQEFEITKGRVEDWVERWKLNSSFSAFLVFKKEGNNFLGLIALDYDPKCCTANLSFLFHKSHWHQGFGKEAIQTVLGKVPCAALFTNVKEPLKQINATVRADNPYAIKILESAEMKRIEECEKDGQTHYIYSKKT